MVYPLSKSQKLGYYFLVTGGRWAWARLNIKVIDAGWSLLPQDHPYRQLTILMRYLELGYRIFTILNFLVFLSDGKYRSLVERLLRMRLVYIRSRVSRLISFELMNQQLLWQGLSELLHFLLPLINFYGILAFFKKIKKWFGFGATLSQEGCPVCHVNPINLPYVASCGDTFCYYCLRGSRMAENPYRCPRCNTIVRSQRPWSAESDNGR